MSGRALAQAEISRIFLKDRWIKEVAEKIARDLVGERSSIALSISRGSLSIARKFVGGLAQPCLQPRSRVRKGIKRALHKQMKLLSGCKRRRILTIGHAKLWDHSQNSLGLFLLLLLLFTLRRILL